MNEDRFNKEDIFLPGDEAMEEQVRLGGIRYQLDEMAKIIGYAEDKLQKFIEFNQRAEKKGLEQIKPEDIEGIKIDVDKIKKRITELLLKYKFDTSQPN